MAQEPGSLVERREGDEMTLLTTAEAAKRLGIAADTLSDWRVQSRGPAYVKLGSLVRYPDYEIERFIRDRTIVPTPEGNTGEARQVGVSLPEKRKALLTGHRFGGRQGKHRESAR